MAQQIILINILHFAKKGSKVTHMKKRIYYALLSSVIGLLGTINAGYITYTEVTGQLPVCKPPFQCRTVLESPWLNLGPVPLPAIGVLFFAAVFVAGVVTYLKADQEAEDEKPKEVAGEKVLWYLALTGTAFGAYTLFAMGVLIQGWCLYCLMSDGLLGVNLLLNLWYKKAQLN